MKRGVIIILGHLFALGLFSQREGKSQLLDIFNKAEQCYILDDYQQLDSCLTKYYTVFNACKDNIGDSIDIYCAYYYKMLGTYYYGFAEDSSYASHSELYYRKSLNIFNQRNNTTNASILHEELAQLYYKTLAYEKAKVLLDSAFYYYDERLHDMGITSVEPNYYKIISQQAICNARLGDFDLALKQIEEAINSYYRKHNGNEYYEAIRKRGKILMLQADSLGSTYYKKAVDCYQQYVNERYASINKEMQNMTDSQRNQYWLATHQFLYDCFRLGNLASEMLYDLTLFSKDYLIRRNATQTRWKQVRQVLGAKDCAIEFVQYFGKNDKRRIGCLVLKKNSKKPSFIDLFSTDSLLHLPLTDSHTIGSAITYPRGTIKDTLYNDTRLPDIIWTKPLMSAIGDSRNIYFSPDGLLNQLAIEYLMQDTTKVCYRLTSTRILTQQKTMPKTESALLCGGIRYSTYFHPNDKNNDVAAYRFLTPQITHVNDLYWSRVEVDSIRALRNKPNDTLLIGRAATDEAFLHLLKQHYDIVHISTHGYFGGRIGIYNDIKPLLGEDSMSKSGLLFAGSVTTLTDKTFDENMFDGVLSATELSRQDLSKSELFVLSACQTGLGRLTDDGIYGIQRGLKLAGAKAMILTLWSVDDYSSHLLMRYFYEEIEKQSSKDIHTAFYNARLRLMQTQEIRHRFDEATFTYTEDVLQYNTPKHINPFIIIDAY